MAAKTLLQRDAIAVIDYRCSAAPGDAPFVEVHPAFSVSYVRKGSFGCRSRGRSFERGAGSILVGHPGDEYMCTQDHVCGHGRLSFRLAPDLVGRWGHRPDSWRPRAAPTIAR